MASIQLQLTILIGCLASISCYLFYGRLALFASPPIANSLPTSFSRKDTAFITTLPRCHVSVLAVSSLQRANAHLRRLTCSRDMYSTSRRSCMWLRLCCFRSKLIIIINRQPPRYFCNHEFSCDRFSILAWRSTVRSG